MSAPPPGVTLNAQAMRLSTAAIRPSRPSPLTQSWDIDADEERRVQWLPCVGLYLYLFFSLSRVQDWWPPFLGQPVDYYCLVLIGFGLLSHLGRSRVRQALASSQSLAILAYIAVAAGSMGVNGAAGAVGHVGELLRLYVMFLAFATFLRGARAAQLALLLFIAIAALIAYQGNVMVATGIGWAGQPLYWGGRIRWVGLYDGANVLCMLLVIAVALAGHLMARVWGLLTRTFAAVAAVVCVHGVYLTGSRGGFLALVVAAIVTVVLRRTDKPVAIQPTRLAAAGLVAVLLLGVAPARLDQLHDDAHSSAGRIDAWQEGLEMLKATNMLGVGYGQWGEHHWRLAHNSVVQTLGETGFEGLFAWLAIILCTVKGLLTVRVPERDPRERSIATGALVALAGFLTCSYFITTTQFDLLYILSGLSVALAGPGQGRLKPRDYGLLAGMTLVLLISVYVTVRVFYATS